MVITRWSWKPFVCKGAWVRIPPSPFNGATEAQKILGIDRTSIRRCCIGEKKDTKGRTDDERLQWLYYEDYLKSTTLSGVSA